MPTCPPPPGRSKTGEKFSFLAEIIDLAPNIQSLILNIFDPKRTENGIRESLINLVVYVEAVHVLPVPDDDVDELVGRGVLPKEYLDDNWSYS